MQIHFLILSDPQHSNTFKLLVNARSNSLKRPTKNNIPTCSFTIFLDTQEVFLLTSTKIGNLKEDYNTTCIKTKP